ncbi:hypothetical protein lam_635 [Candidatus Liberibacter americanus str. Sao Paulo]|uniref:Uncharacterized protein n=1 Tax=Candidatus Liberibacter americanus str. Sao Paulo TaxID=1261131 RepID=U6B7Z6_9HYPH|nr:hypothetical protein lam_635 [Candidatus Liberibacter americanus str. Sao Paulo]
MLVLQNIKQQVEGGMVYIGLFLSAVTLFIILLTFRPRADYCHRSKLGCGDCDS